MHIGKLINFDQVGKAKENINYYKLYLFFST